MAEKKSPAPAKKTAKPAAKKAAPAKAAPEKKSAKTADAFAGRAYHYAVGRRKTSVARVRLFPGGTGEVVVNDRPAKVFFSVKAKLDAAFEPLKTAGLAGTADLSIRVLGGGITGQAEAIRLGVARALAGLDAAHRPALKTAGFLRRDPRQVERKKYGLKKARRSEQFSKR